ncbi:MAG: thiamine ABC transporter substrate-binding protein, partial [Clostridium perfringens]|nr:thiamine ABC transporter substrate-binding protein [Clostridium perfringens]
NPNRYEDIDEEINQGKTKTQIKEERKKKKSAEKSARALRAQLRDVEKLIPQKEEELEKLQEMLCTEEVYSNPEESVRVNKEINSVQEEIDSLYATWEELSESLEE